MEIFDNHTHLNDKPFRGKEKYYLQRAKQLGVTHLICAGQDPDFNRRAIALAQEFPNVYAMVGYSPDVAKDYDQKAEAELIKQLQRPKVVAVGEIGLDYYWDESPRAVQRQVFARQLALARDLHLPADIHTRDAFPDCYDILKRADLKYGAILHSFNGGPKWLAKFLPLNVYFSFSGVVSFTKAEKVHESAKMVPMNRFLVETDAPYLTPKPYRGRQNETGYARYVAAAIAKIKDLSLSAVASASFNNTVKVYGLEQKKI